MMAGTTGQNLDRARLLGAGSVGCGRQRVREGYRLHSTRNSDPVVQPRPLAARGVCGRMLGYSRHVLLKSRYGRRRSWRAR